MGYKEILKSTESMRARSADNNQNLSVGNEPENGHTSNKFEPPVNATEETKTQEPATTHSPALELDLVLRNGDHWSFPYSYKSAMQFDASGKIILHFASHTVTIKGRNLGKVYKALLAHSAREIRERETEFDDLPDNATVITSIDVKES